MTAFLCSIFFRSSSGVFDMTVSPNVLIGPRLKVQRAYRHIEELRSITNPLHRDWYVIAFVPYTFPPNTKPTKFGYEYRPTKPIAEILALIIGDAVHNLRTALDHLATGIARTADASAEIHYPMCKAREDLIARPGAKLSGAHKALGAVEQALPGATKLILDEIRPANGPNDSLWGFHPLDNDDKHNLLIPTVSVTSVDNLNCVIGTNRIMGGNIGGDATKPIRLIRSDVPFSINDDFYTSVEVKFGQGGPFENDPVVSTLTQIAGLITHTINKFENLINQTP